MIADLQALIGIVFAPLAIIAAGATVITITLLVIIDVVFDMVDRR